VVAGVVLVFAVPWWWLRTRLLVVTVDGPSMAPTLLDGQRLLARRTGRPPGRGDVVVASPFGDGRLVVKRVAAIAGDALSAGVVPVGTVVLLGDNAEESVDSRTWGPVRVTAVRARILRPLRGAPVQESLVDSSGPITFRPRMEGEKNST
jgi:signal peptidase I